MAAWTDKIFDRILVVMGALLFLQFPLFMHQYQQQLIGRVAELQWQMNEMHNAAERSGKSLEQLIQKFLVNKDQDVVLQGRIMEKVVTRWIKLSQNLTALTQSTVFTRPWVFILYLQWEVLRSTAHSFEFGLPFTLEGVIYALVGIGFGFLIYRILKIIWMKATRIYRGNCKTQILHKE